MCVCSLCRSVRRHRWRAYAMFAYTFAAAPPFAMLSVGREFRLRPATSGTPAAATGSAGGVGASAMATVASPGGGDGGGADGFGGDAARAIVAPFAVSPGVSFVDQARDRRDAAEMQCAAPHAATPFPVGAAQQRERRADSP